MALIRLPSGQLVDVFTTHLIAEYAVDDEYLAQRHHQMMEAVQFVRDCQEKCTTSLTVLLGDFNSTPESAIVSLAKSVMQSSTKTDAEPTLAADFDGKAKRLDYIFFQGRDFELEVSRVCFNNEKLM
jgi:endonuclease/exonuclease/phosphatase family metal-dependent hydrolase